MMADLRTLTHQEWLSEATQRFGPDAQKWAFKCPSCGHVATVAEYKAAGASEGQVAFNCIGRHKPTENTVIIFKPDKGDGCNYTQGGLFGLSTTLVTLPDGRSLPCFDFAPAEAGGLA
jgi:predicted RNA-binding Zn-ribbon protein involved in translation (DUF1610 family)